MIREDPFFSRVMAYLNKTGWASGPSHLRYLVGLIPDSEFKKLSGLMDRNKELIVLSPFSVLLVIKLLLLYGQPRPGTLIPSTVPKDLFLDVLLFSNDNSDPSYPPGMDLGPPNRARAAASLIRLWTFRLEPSAILKSHVARSHHIYVTLADRLGPQRGISFRDVVQTSIGMTPFEFLALGFGALATALNKTEEDIQKGEVLSFNPKTYFTHAKVGPARVERFFDELSAEPVRLGRLLEELEPGVPIQSQLVAFARRPFVRTAPEELCLIAPEFLEGAISTGLLHLALRHPDAETRRRVLEFNGVLIDEYVREVLSSIYPEATGIANRLHPHPPHEGGELTDYLIDSRPTFVLFEAKASWITREVLLRADLDAYLAEFKKKYVVSDDDGRRSPKGIGQLLRACGALATSGYPPLEIGRVPAGLLVPVLVTAQPLPQFEYLWGRYRELHRCSVKRTDLTGKKGLEKGPRPLFSLWL